MNTDNFLIEEEDLELAQDVCNIIKDETLRNRAVANALAANIARKFFTDFDGEVDSKSGLHNIGYMLENLDISDIYLKNNYIDVRVYFNENEICVPKSHFDNGLEPVAYMFIKLDKDLTNGAVEGFILSENVDKNACKSGFYHIDTSALVSFYEIEPSLVLKEDTYSLENKDIFNYFDGCIDDQNSFYSALLASKDARNKLACIDRARRTLAYVSVPELSNVEESEENISDINFANEETVSFELASQDNEDDNLVLAAEEESLELVLEEETELVSGFDDVDTIDELQQIDDSVETSSELIEGDILEVDSFSEDVQSLEEHAENDNFELGINSSDVDAVMIDASDIYNTEEGMNCHIESDALLPDEYDNEVSAEGIDIVESDEIATADDFTSMIDEKQDDIVNNSEDVESSNQILDETSNIIDEQDLDFVAEEESSVDDIQQEALSNDIEQLYQKEDEEVAPVDDDAEMEIYHSNTSSGGSGKFILFIILAAIIGGAGFYGYNKYFNPSNQAFYPNEVQDVSQKPIVKEAIPEKKIEAMPIESVETTYNTKKNDDYGVAETIPAIEQNLDASVLVSNLKADWEVPATYTSSPVAKRYLTKLGKIIQLNLKTELLLLSKPPITNKITLEIQYNSKFKKFETVGITMSSGEKTVDNVILQTVQKALNMHLSSNMDAFAVLKGNPVLVIRL